jgi:hypothetical protein
LGFSWAEKVLLFVESIERGRKRKNEQSGIGKPKKVGMNEWSDVHMTCGSEVLSIWKEKEKTLKTHISKKIKIIKKPSSQKNGFINNS